MAQREKEADGGRPEIVDLAVSAIEDKLGKDIRIFDVRGRSSVTDYFLVASAQSAPQLKAMASSVAEKLRAQGTGAYRKGGGPESGWVVLDYFDLVIHLFLQETREYYAIEELWEQKVGNIA